LQSVGELLISPIGYAMIGKLAPAKYQGIMMGSWMLVTGLASLFAGDFSGMVPEPTGTTAIATNPGYATLFSRLGWGSVVAGVMLVALVRYLRELIGDTTAPATGRDYRARRPHRPNAKTGENRQTDAFYERWTIWSARAIISRTCNDGGVP
jgi:hypothetical protein